MKDRTANVVFWIGTLIGLAIALMFWNDDWKIALAIASFPAAFGWSLRYVLTGRK